MRQPRLQLRRLLLGAAYVGRQAEVSSARDDAEKATQQVAVMQRQVQKLKPFEDAEAQINTQVEQVNGALATDIDIPQFMDRLVGQMPADVSWTAFTLSVSASAPAPGQPAPTSLGTITVSGNGLSQDSAAHWLTEMRKLGILSDVWVQSSTKTTGENITFASTATVTFAAKSDRAGKYKVSAL